MAKLKFKPVPHNHEAFLAKAGSRKGIAEAYKALELEYQVADQMLRARSRAGLTQDAVAEKMGMTSGTLSPVRCSHGGTTMNRVPHGNGLEGSLPGLVPVLIRQGSILEGHGDRGRHAPKEGRNELQFPADELWIDQFGEIDGQSGSLSGMPIDPRLKKVSARLS